MENYTVIVGNVGTVYDGSDILEAQRIYEHYKRMSKRSEGRCADEDVTMMRDGEVTYEHFGQKE